MTATSLSSGRFTSGQIDAWISPRVRSDRRLVVACHGAGGTGDDWVGAGQPSSGTLSRALADAGYLVVAFTAVDSWGNATSRSRINDAIAYARTDLGASDDPVVLLGASMGAAVALRYAYTDPTEVACLVGLIPAVDLSYIRTNNLLSTRAAIDAAWAVTYPAALPANADPAVIPASFADLPAAYWYASNDTISTGLDTFAAATGAETHSVGALGHTDAAVAAVDPAAVVAFIAANT